MYGMHWNNWNEKHIEITAWLTTISKQIKLNGNAYKKFQASAMCQHDQNHIDVMKIIKLKNF